MNRFLVLSLTIGLSRAAFAASGEPPLPQASGTAAVTSADAGGTPPSSSATSQSPALDSRPVDEQLIYSVNRTAERTSETGRAVWVITQQDIRRTNARTLPEALMEVPGLFLQQTAYGTGVPVIRGMSRQEVLILIDGIKVNNSTYGSSSLPYLATVDLSMVERIEVVRGPGEIFATETLGGVINVITKKGPPRGEATAAGSEAVARFSSADSGFTGRFDLFGRNDRLRYFAGGTARNAHDVTAGGSLTRQRGTGYGEGAANASIEYFPTSERTVFLRYLRLDQQHVPRTDRIASGSSLFEESDPRDLELTSVGYQDLTFRSWRDSFSVTGYVNRQSEDLRRITKANPQNQRLYLDAQRVFGLNVDVVSHIGTSQRLVYGMNYSRERIDSRRQDLNFTTGAVTLLRGNFPDGSSYGEFGAFLKHRLKVRERLTIMTGGRYARTSSGGVDNTPIGPIDLEGQHGSFSGTLSSVLRVTHQLNVVSGFLAASRPANLRDLSGFSTNASAITVPNPGVHAERISTFELGMTYSAPRVSGSAFYYNNRERDVLRIAPGLFNGLPFVDTNGNGIQDPGEPSVVQQRNIGRVRINGYELEGHYILHPQVVVYGNVAHTLGDDTTLDTIPLSGVPPLFGTMALRFTGDARIRPWGELSLQFAGKQDRLSPSDISSVRTGPAGTASFRVFHLRGGLTLARRVDFSLELQNLTDQAYKYHGSGLFRPGFQVVTGLAYRLF